MSSEMTSRDIFTKAVKLYQIYESTENKNMGRKFNKECFKFINSYMGSEENLYSKCKESKAINNFKEIFIAKIHATKSKASTLTYDEEELLHRYFYKLEDHVFSNGYLETQACNKKLVSILHREIISILLTVILSILSKDFIILWVSICGLITALNIYSVYSALRLKKLRLNSIKARKNK